MQGVFFRASTRNEAQRLGLTGWVRNAADGSVEVEAQGDDAAVEALIAFCRNDPGHSRVEDVTVDDIPLVDPESSFLVR